jgi:hypothetical protein
VKPGKAVSGTSRKTPDAATLSINRNREASNGLQNRQIEVPAMNAAAPNARPPPDRIPANKADNP